MKKYLLVLTAALLFSGCTKELHFVKTDLLAVQKTGRIKEGVTTQDEILTVFGTPETHLKVKDGETFFYKDGNLKALWIEFDTKGVVKKFIFSEK